MNAGTHVDDISFYREDGETIVWKDRSGDLPFPKADGGSDWDDPALLIHLKVDGNITVVEGQRVDRAVLRQTIIDLQYLLDRLDRVYLPDESRGRCMTWGDWGACYGQDGHEEPHRFPTAPKDYVENLARAGLA